MSMNIIIIIISVLTQGQTATWFSKSASTYEYGYFSKPLTFENAVDACYKRNGYLTNISTFDQFEFVKRNIPSNVDTWIGVKQTNPGATQLKNRWQYIVNGNSISKIIDYYYPSGYEKCLDGAKRCCEQNVNCLFRVNYPKREKCMAIDGSRGTWRDSECKTELGYVCERRKSISSQTTTVPPTTSNLLHVVEITCVTQHDAMDPTINMGGNACYFKETQLPTNFVSVYCNRDIGDESYTIILEGDMACEVSPIFVRIVVPPTN